jgi:predicted carbohydrate-binding protein with CBM5 and CBM33 domain
MKSSAAIRLQIATCALIASTIQAHGYLSYPSATYIDSITKTAFSAKITESVNAGFQGKKWNDSPEKNAATFTQSWPSTGYMSLRELVDPSVPGCPNTRLDVDPINVTGQNQVRWQNDEEQKGFVDSHHVSWKRMISSIPHTEINRRQREILSHRHKKIHTH